MLISAAVMTSRVDLRHACCWMNVLFTRRLLMSKAVFCIAKSNAVAKDIVEKLKVMGFSGNDISVLFPDRSGTKDFAYEQHTKAPEGATAGGLVGASAGGVMGWLVGFGKLAIPGIGPFRAAGALIAAFAGSRGGGGARGI